MAMATQQLVRRVLLTGAVVISVPVLSTAAATPKAARDSGVTLMNAHGFSLNTYPRSGTLARVRVRFDGGFTIKLRAGPRRRTFGYYTVNGEQGPLFGYFMIPPGPLPPKVGLIGIRDTKTQTSSKNVLSASLTTGARPALVITGFPMGATELEFGTSGTGKAGSYITSPCIDRLRSVRGSMLITTRGNKKLRGTVAPGLLCGGGAPYVGS